MAMKSKNVKMDESLWKSLAGVGKDIGVVHDEHGNHSELIREIVSAAVIRWQESPYVSLSAQYLVFVNRYGNVFLRQVQVLKLNKKRERLPCLLEMKPEKRRDFLESEHGREGESDFFRSRWLINYFGVWHGSDIARGKILDAWVDRRGIDAKQADLRVEQGPGPILTREIVVGGRDYVQWRPKGSRHEYDRVGFPIDIPTRQLEALVVVDMDLYKDGTLSYPEVPLLDLEFRNRESARFEEGRIAHDRWNPMDPAQVGKHLEEAPDPNAEEIVKELADFKERVMTLAQQEVQDGPVVPPEQRPELENALTIPRQFLYYKVGWPSPYLGIEICVRWQKPEKELAAVVDG